MDKLYRYVVSGFGIAICFVLTILSAVYSCYMDDVWASFHETTIFSKDNVALNILILICFLILFISAAKLFDKVKLSDRVLEILHYAILALIGILGIIWVINAHLVPRDDQLFIQESLESFVSGDKTPFLSGGYIFVNPHQAGYMWISFLVTRIFGLKNYIALQILNVLGLMLFYEAITRLFEEMGFGKGIGIMTLVCGVLFYPLILYTTFVYGNMLGLSFAVTSIWRVYCMDRKRPVLNAVLSAVFMMLAIICKQNSIIFAIALIIVLFVKLAEKRNLKSLCTLLLICLSVFMGTKSVHFFTEKVTGCELDSGIPAVSYIAMGLQEGERAPGWFNEYIRNVAYECGFEAKTQKEIAIKDIKQSLATFTGNPQYAFVFFLNKTKSQWANPTFQGIWVNQFSSDAQLQPQWVQSVISFDNAMVHVKYLNAITLIIFFGAFLYMIVCGKNDKYAQSLVLMLVVIGGFIFHMFWEGKSEYVITYFVLLIPYACASYVKLAERFGKKNEQQSTDNT